MKEIHIIKDIKLNNKGLLVKDENDKWVRIHRRQGELDGACAVYALVMNLLYLGILCEEDFDIYKKADKRTREGKFLAHLLENQGLIREGYHYKQLEKEINEYLGERVIAKRIYYNNIDKIIENIDTCLKNDIPAIISVYFQYGGKHALLVIGKETNSKGNITKLFCLDPGIGISPFFYWNCIIDVSSKSECEYPFWYITEEPKRKVRLDDIIKIDKKINI